MKQKDQDSSLKRTAKKLNSSLLKRNQMTIEEIKHAGQAAQNARDWLAVYIAANKLNDPALLNAYRQLENNYLVYVGLARGELS